MNPFMNVKPKLSLSLEPEIFKKVCERSGWVWVVGEWDVWGDVARGPYFKVFSL